jgi:GTP-binding protein
MTNLPKLAIVGRPNVGKSALFNRICKKKIAIVDEAEGITRDRLYTKADFFGHPFELIDTGGMDYHSQAVFNEHILRQAEIAIEEADTIVMVVDAHMGITKLDKEIAQILLKTKKPVCLAVNKVDNLDMERLMHEFHSLGIKKMIPVSAAQGWHIAELLETAFESFKKEDWADKEDNATNITIVGRPNVGKSSLVNYLLDEERCIVSPVAGTTRDNVDVLFEENNNLYRLIDTAGIRRKGSEHEVVDKFAAIRTQRAIERADICILMLDAQQGLTAQDKKIANMIEEAGKGCILIFNKWDLVKGFRMEHCLKGIEEEASFLKHCPKLFVSALTGRNIGEIFKLVQEVKEHSQLRISTHQLNKFIENALQRNHPPMIMGKRLRIYYMAQVDTNPPKFVLFVNYPNLMIESYKKYLYNQFREIYGFTGLPLTLHLKGKKKSKEDKEEKGSKAKTKPKAVLAENDLGDDFEDDYSDKDDDFVWEGENG